MEENQKRLLEEIRQSGGLNISPHRRALHLVFRCGIEVVNSIYEAKLKLNENEVYIETLLGRILFSSLSIIQISKGTTLTRYNLLDEGEIIDTPSAYVILRSIIEAFLTAEYLHFNNTSEDEKQFRFKLWKLSGLKTRQSIYIKDSVELPKVQQNDKQLITELENDIKKDPLFESLSKSEVWKFDNYGLPRKMNWRELRESSMLKTDLLNTMYSIITEYSHAEYLSAIQINQGSLNSIDPVNLNNIVLTTNFAGLINCVAIKMLCDKFDEAQNTFNDLPKDAQSLINTWHDNATTPYKQK